MAAHILRCTIRTSLASSSRAFHTSLSQHDITKFTMPAMSPTMTEGGLANWKVKEGQTFSAGDVLLEIETDKATMDVEAQEDGVLAKIVIEAGAKSVPVGKIIAMLAEEGDDIANVEVPEESGFTSGPPATDAKEQPLPTSEAQPKKAEQEKTQPVPTHGQGHLPDLGRPLFPSVSRLLLENNISADDAKKITGTGLHGMLTKGDVLAFLGKASNPTGTYKVGKPGVVAQSGGPVQAAAKKSSEPLTASDVRGMIFSGLSAGSHAARAKVLASKPVASPTRKASSAFDELLNDYEFRSVNTKNANQRPIKDEFAGIV